MKSKSNFWLALHDLACELQKEGETDAQRAASIASVLPAAPCTVSDTYIANLELVAGTLSIILASSKAK